MTLSLTGTYRHRLRVNFLFFWLVDKWRTDPISVSYPIPEKSGTVKLSDSIKIRTTIIKTGLRVSVLFMGYEAFVKEFEVGVHEEKIHSEPVKGCILDAVLKLA